MKIRVLTAPRDESVSLSVRICSATGGKVVSNESASDVFDIEDGEPADLDKLAGAGFVVEAVLE